ncbi:hypothetical protein FRC10_001935 [Ceratobasidium sp. 414]|nr:hypothetical protein FRC10_001935 [Ceratobasidium sp. 414]
MATVTHALELQIHVKTGDLARKRYKVPEKALSRPTSKISTLSSNPMIKYNLIRTVANLFYGDSILESPANAENLTLAGIYLLKDVFYDFSPNEAKELRCRGRTWDSSVLLLRVSSAVTIKAS